MGKKSKSDETPMERLKNITKLQLGSLCIIGGIAANILMPMIMRMGPPPANSAAARGQAFGSAVASLLFIIAGIVLIILHFVGRKRPERKKRGRR
jgi:hypothetical protein